MLDLEKTIREYIPEIIHMSLATCVNNKPWVCEVHFAWDNDLNLYFRSLATTRHSTEIRANGRVAGNIVTQHTGEQAPRGVYFEGTAEELQNIDKENIAFKVYKERFDADEDILEGQDKEDGHRFYKITVEKFYVFDARETKPSQKFELNWSEKKN